MKKINIKKSRPNKEEAIEKLIELFQQYKGIKKLKDIVPKRSLPPLTLDERLENVNPYYVSNEIIKYG